MKWEKKDHIRKSGTGDDAKRSIIGNSDCGPDPGTWTLKQWQNENPYILTIN